jgi:hypothetical protein
MASIGPRNEILLLFTTPMDEFVACSLALAYDETEKEQV